MSKSTEDPDGRNHMGNLVQPTGVLHGSITGLFDGNLAGSMQLRHRGHNFALPTIHLEFNKRHFVARVLFDYV